MHLHIPNPCHQKWDEMTPNEKGRHCQACNKTVVDFTKMTDDEVLSYFAQHKDQKICGKVHKSQLAQNEVEITIPQSAIKKGLNRWQVFGLSLLLVFGVVLTGFTDTHQTKAIFKLEQHYIAFGIDTPPPMPPVLGHIVPENINSEELIGDIVFDNILPSYKGGEAARQKYLKEKLSKIDFTSYKDSLPRKVWVDFIIDTTGLPKQVKINKGGLDSAFNQQIINIVEQMPAWEPGRLFDKPEIVRMRMPIKILTKE